MGDAASLLLRNSSTPVLPICYNRMSELGTNPLSVRDGGNIAARLCRQGLNRGLTGSFAIEVRCSPKDGDPVEVKEVGIGAAPKGRQRCVVFLLRRAVVGLAVGDQFRPCLHCGTEL